MMEQESLEANPTKVNMSERERQLSLFGGAILMGIALARRGRLGLGFGPLGASLIYQGISGISPVYQLLKKNRAVHDPSAPISVPHEQGKHISASTIINHPVEEIYAFWRDFNNLPLFLPFIKSVDLQDGLRSTLLIKGPMDKVIKSEIEIINDEPNTVIGWRSISNSYFNHAGAVRFSPSPMNEGTEVRVEMEYLPLGGKAADKILSILGKSPDQEISDSLWRLKQLFEVGEIFPNENQGLDGL
jgi:uncharacterized membrane protein